LISPDVTDSEWFVGELCSKLPNYKIIVPTFIIFIHQLMQPYTSIMWLRGGQGYRIGTARK